MSLLAAVVRPFAGVVLVAACATTSQRDPTVAAATAPSLATAKTIDECFAADTSTAWERVARAFSRDTAHTWSDDNLRRRLLALADSDQMARTSAGMRDSLGDAGFRRRMRARDSASDAALRGIVMTQGWPTRSLVGIEGEHAAWQPLGYSPIEDAAGVEARRASVGLPPLRVYSCMMRVMYGRPVAPPG